MKARSEWVKEAYCAKDSNPFAWTSYDIRDVRYAKHGCSICTVRTECFLNAINNDPYTGTNAGISEYDFLIATWKEAKKVDGSNWARTDRALQKLLQKVK